MTVQTIALLALEDMIDMGIAEEKTFPIRKERTDTTGKYCQFFQSKKDLELDNPFLSISMNLDSKPMIVQHFYNFEHYKSFG